MGKFCGNANVNTAVLVPTEERVSGGITLPDREFATKEFPHSSCRFIAKFISRVLLWSLLTVVRNTLRQLSRLLVQLKSKFINQVKPSFFEVISGEFFIGKNLTQGTLPCQIPPPLGETANFAPPILQSTWLARSPTPCPSGGSRWHAHYSYIIIMHVWVTENNYQLHYLVTAVPLENRTIPKKS